jgi:hypothetical protein
MVSYELRLQSREAGRWQTHVALDLELTGHERLLSVDFTLRLFGEGTHQLPGMGLIDERIRDIPGRRTHLYRGERMFKVSFRR